MRMTKFVGSFSGISVDNLGKAKEFYVELLGLSVIDESMGLQLSLPGGGELFIYEKQDHAPASYTSLNFIVEDITSTVDELAGKGVVFEHYDFLPADQDERGILRGKAVEQGPDIAWFEDPAGNVLSIIEP